MAAAALEQSISAHDSFFTGLVGLIPAHYYREREDDEEQAFVPSKYAQNLKGKAPKQEVKERTKKAKKAKFDPATPYTALEAQQVEGEKQPASDGTSLQSRPSLSRDELKKLLEAKIAEKRGKRKAESERPDTAREGNKKKRARLEKEANTKTRAGGGVAVKGPTAGGSGPGDDGHDSGQAIVFSKFDFGGQTSAKKKRTKAPAQVLLKKAEAAKEKLQQLKQEDQDKAAKVENKMQWAKALDKAEGQKVFDDPKRIKKMIKKKEKLKEKSKKDWDNRVKEVERQKEERQAKRQANIQKRIDAKKERIQNKRRKAKGKSVKKPKK